MDKFKLVSKFRPTGDQPRAIKQLTKNLENGVKDQVLLGVTGSGKTFTMAKVIEKVQKPTLIISPNKTLAAQLYQEFKEFFPNNAVHYFVSYYDYYQPEAYIPHSDTYIEKDAKINEEIDRLRHSAVQDVTVRKDVIVVASVSCIYNIGSPKNYENISLEINPVRKKLSKTIISWEVSLFSNRVKLKQGIKRKDFLSLLTSLQYQRNDVDFKPGTFRVRGEIIEIYIVTGEKVLRIEFLGDKIDKISEAKPGLAQKYKSLGNKTKIFPAHFWVTPEDKLKIAIGNIQLELEERLKQFKKQKKLLEAERLEQKTNYDLEMLKETGWCHGIENYSSHMEFRKPGQAPFSLVDYFNHFNPKGSLIFIDESHISVSQIRAMSVQDKIRKQTLIDFGFRLPSAIDNRPLNFLEFQARQKQTIYVSATPADFEKQKSGKHIIEQIIRPTGLLEPKIEIRKTDQPAGGQINDLIKEIEKEIEKNQRVLVVTLTKRLAEEISEYLINKGIKTQYLHSEVKTMERPKILKDFREGKYDVLVGINLLREGLDLPEVSLVSMKNAINEINRRRKVQETYNKKNNITPTTIISAIREWGFSHEKEVAKSVKEEFLIHDKKLLEKEMKIAAKNLDFERAAEIRDILNNKTK